MFKWQDSTSKVSEAEDVQVFQTYNNNDEFYTKESINTLLEAMMKMSFVKIIFDKFSPRGVNDIYTDVYCYIASPSVQWSSFSQVV